MSNIENLKQEALETKETFVKVEIKDDSRSLMTCGGGPLCNESR